MMDMAHLVKKDGDMDDCPVCGGDGDGVHARGQYWVGEFCYACGGKGTLPWREAERLRENERSRREAEGDPGWKCPDCGRRVETGLDCVACMVDGPILARQKSAQYKSQGEGR